MTPTRRQILARTGTVVGTACVSGVAASQITGDEVETWEPPAGTWPCSRYDPGKTAANPHATVPSDPVIDWRTEVTSGRFVVGPERLYVAGDRLTALDRRDGTVQWTRREPRGELVVRDETLYHGSGYNGTERGTLSALEARSGTPRWRSEYQGELRDLTATEGYLVVDGRAYDIADGQPAWTFEDRTAVPNSSLACDGFLYNRSSRDRLAKYGNRSVLDETLDRGPRPVWKQKYDSLGSITVIRAGRGVGGRLGSLDAGPVLTGIDTETGRLSWSALTPAEFDAETDGYYDDPDEYGLITPAMALGTDRCVVTAETHGLGDSEAAREEGSALFAVSPSDGSVEWSRSVSSAERSVSDVVVADGTVIVAADQPESRNRPMDDGITGDIVALDGETGSIEWELSTDGDPRRLAVVGETVFALTGDDTTVSLLALR
jgi:outer membrane protein assembly factor BamB